MADVEPVFEAIAKAVLRFEHLVISCEFVARLQQLGQQLNAYAEGNGLPGRVITVPAPPANDTWARDHGPPITVDTADGPPALLDFRFNAWGGDKFPWEKDDASTGTWRTRAFSANTHCSQWILSWKAAL